VNPRLARAFQDFFRKKENFLLPTHPSSPYNAPHDGDLRARALTGGKIVSLFGTP
jgi:hypothetical protein